MVLCAIDMPADWDAANLTFQASYNTGGTFDDLYDQYGTETSVTAAADRYIPSTTPPLVGGALPQGALRNLWHSGQPDCCPYIQLVTKPV
jgi:hypothetical protein